MFRLYWLHISCVLNLKSYFSPLTYYPRTKKHNNYYEVDIRIIVSLLVTTVTLCRSGMHMVANLSWLPYNTCMLQPRNQSIRPSSL